MIFSELINRVESEKEIIEIFYSEGIFANKQVP